MKLDLLTNAIVVDDAIRFVPQKSKEKLKSSANDSEHDSEHDKEESKEPDYDEDQLEEEQEEEAEGDNSIIINDESDFLNLFAFIFTI
ncbi:MAG: hypothetical protein ACJ71R_21625 [Nitrososphaeraceae archaeon]